MQHHYANRVRVAEKRVWVVVIAVCAAVNLLIFGYPHVAEILSTPPAPVPEAATIAVPETGPTLKRTDSMADTGWIALSNFRGYGWQVPTNAASNNGLYTTLFHDVDTESRDALWCTELSTPVPANAAIDEIDMRYEVRASGDSDSLKESSFQLVVGGVKSGISFADSRLTIGTAPELRTRTGILATSGLSLTDDDVNASDFGLSFVFVEDNSGSDGTVEIDYVEIRVHYTPATENATIDATLPGLTAKAAYWPN